MLLRIKEYFTESIQIQIESAEILPTMLSVAAQSMVGVLLEGKKILVCGQGNASGIAAGFTAKLVDRFETERPSLPAICLNDNHLTQTLLYHENQYIEIYAKQIRALAHKGDILFILSAYGRGNELLKAIEIARSREMQLVVVTGVTESEFLSETRPEDIIIQIPTSCYPRIEEMFLLVSNCLCNLIDYRLFSH